MRPIETTGFAQIKPALEALGPAPQLQWIRIADLVVDDAYQRPLTSQGSRRNVRIIAERFDWRRFAPVIVSPVEGGRYAIVDGQHRVTGALLRGIETVPCNVVLADRDEQARAFEAINGAVTRVTPLQIFRARLAAKEGMALRIEKVAREAGIRILLSNRSARQMKAGETMSLEAITRAITQHGDAVTVLALRAIAAAAAGQGGWLNAPLIAAMTAVLADHEEWATHPRLLDGMPGIALMRELDKATSTASTNRDLKRSDLVEAAIITALAARLRPSAPVPAAVQSPGERFRALKAAE